MQNQDNIDKKVKALQYITSELYTTEKSYNKSLTEIYELFTNPNVARKPSQVNLSSAEYKEFVTLLTGLLENSNIMLDLSERFKNLHNDYGNNQNKITDLIAEISTALKNSESAFTKYATLYEKIAANFAEINYEKKSAFNTLIASQNATGIADTSYLNSRTITGIQRFPRYQMLFTDYAKNSANNNKAIINNLNKDIAEIGKNINKEYRRPIMEYIQKNLDATLKQKGITITEDIREKFISQLSDGIVKSDTVAKQILSSKYSHDDKLNQYLEKSIPKLIALHNKAVFTDADAKSLKQKKGNLKDHPRIEESHTPILFTNIKRKSLEQNKILDNREPDKKLNAPTQRRPNR